MANKTIYKIKITNFEKHNKGIKKSYKKFMLSTGFLTDAKVRQLTPATTLLFLSCIAVAAESCSCHIEVTHESLCYQSKVKSGSLQSQLDLLQSLQLLTYEKIAPNIIEVNRNEVKRREENINTVVVELKNEEVKKPEVQNSTQSFDDQFKFSDWVNFLQSLEMATPYVTRNIRAIASSFGEKEKLEEFLVSIAESKNFKNMNKTQARRYAVSAILREAGLK